MKFHRFLTKNVVLDEKTIISKQINKLDCKTCQKFVKLQNCGFIIRCWIWWARYSSNKIRKTQIEHLNIVCQNLNSQNCEFDANFLTFLALYHLAGNLRYSYLIITVISMNDQQIMFWSKRTYIFIKKLWRRMGLPNFLFVLYSHYVKVQKYEQGKISFQFFEMWC